MRAFSKRFGEIDPQKNYYRILKLKEDASQQEVKKNFHRLAMFYHPDRNKGLHQEKFKLVNEAYQILSDKEMRDEYDRIRVPED